VEANNHKGSQIQVNYITKKTAVSDMARWGKYLSLFLVVLLSVSILWIITPSSAQTTPDITPYPEIPKPSVPQFTVKLIDSSYDIPAFASINPYTGQTTTQPIQHIEARTIEIRIKNEAITPFEVKLGTSTWTAGLQYNIRWKGHFEDNWHNLFSASDGYFGSDSENPETIFAPQGEYSPAEGLKMKIQGMHTTFPPNSQLEFQVQAMIGFIHRVVTPIPGGGWTFTGQTSDWSSSQTLNLGDPSPSVPEFSIFLILPLFVVPLIAFFALKKRTKTYN
jgi:hypothetical protein